MKSKGWNHIDMTRKQRQLFDELFKRGAPNTLKAHSYIAKEALIAGGATGREANILVRMSISNLNDQGVRIPTRIPWH